MTTDRELLELAAKAVGVAGKWTTGHHAYGTLDIEGIDTGARLWWNPITDDGDRLRLARQLGINIDFADCCAWKRLSDGGLYQEFWGGDCGDEAHAIVGIAAHIGKAMP